MTLCFVTDYHPTFPYFGGIAVYTQRIARALARRGHRVHVVVARADAHADMEDQGVTLHMRHARWLPLIGSSFPGLGESLSIARILIGLNRRHHFDVVEIPNWEGMGLASTFVPGLNVVIRLHTSVAESVEMGGRKPARPERFTIRTERASARRALAVVTHSVSHRERMAASYGRDDIEVIPHGVPIPDEVSPPAALSVLSIGRMNPRKGMDTLLEAIPTVMNQVPNVHFRVAGTGEEHELIRKFRTGHPGLRSVEFLGMVSDQRLRQLYEECALYVSPAIYESFGLTFAEAMAHGRPSVGCAASAVPEIVRDGIDGLLVPPKDATALAGAIVKLLLDEEMRRRMGASARKRAIENYSLEMAAARSEGFFMRVLKQE